MSNKKEFLPSYTGRILLSFICVTVATILLFVVGLTLVWEFQFKQFTRENMQNFTNNISTLISKSYVETGGWTDETISIAHLNSDSIQEIGIQLTDASNEVLYDNTWSTENTGAQIPTNSKIPASKNSIVESDIDAGDEVVGHLKVWSLENDVFLTGGGFRFRTRSYIAIGIAGVIAILISALVAVFVSRTLAKPIKSITSAATSIRNGDLSSRCNLIGSDEVGELGKTFDEMATTVERAIQAEHSLTSDVAHELRTPLMAILVNVEAMQDGVLPADQEHLALIASEVKRLSRLVDAMLKLSHIENGTQAMNIKPVNLYGVVSEVVESQEQLFADQDLTLTLSPLDPNVDYTASIDIDSIKRSIINLLSNSIRYTSSGGRVDVKVFPEKNNVCVSVSDTGMGISKEELPHIFSRFWRSDASRERASGGLGVGLSMVKESVSRQNGKVTVESELGKGSTFTLHLPAVTTHLL